MPSASPSLRESRPLAVLSPWDIQGVHQGFMDRHGGVSRGPYATMNLAAWIGDDQTAVEENWSRWRAAYPAPRVVRLAQVHGNIVHHVTNSFEGSRLAGDGMVTATPGIVLGVYSADCVPILIADERREVVGAFHAGWRGILADIAGAGIRAISALGGRPCDLCAAMGPSIGPCCFEVDLELAERFAHRLPFARLHTTPGCPGKAYMDLRGIIRAQLEAAGLDPALIGSYGPCTQCANDRYFSRRAAGGAVTGLQMSFIGLAN